MNYDDDRPMTLREHLCALGLSLAAVLMATGVLYVVTKLSR